MRLRRGLGCHSFWSVDAHNASDPTKAVWRREDYRGWLSEMPQEKEKEIEYVRRLKAMQEPQIAKAFGRYTKNVSIHR